MHNRHYEKFADGTIKDIEDEIPFEVPEGWEWTKIRCVSSEILYGVSESAKESGKYRLLRITDIQDDKVDWESVPFTDFPEDKVANYILKNGDIVFARTGATVGKSYLIEKLSVESIYASYLIRIRTSQQLNPKYIKYFFGSLCYWNQITDKSSGIGQPNVNGSSLANLYIPIPPYDEQGRILPAIEKSFALIDSLENDKEDLQTAIKQAKSKILDLAIHGKLVSQDSSDEPASVLLEKLRVEKEAKIKAGELKRDKNDSYIYKNTTDNCYYEKFNGKDPVCIDEEIPFDIPKEWTWCRLSELAELKGGKRIPAGMSATKDKTDHIYIRVSDMKNDTITTDDLHYISDTIFEQIKQYIIGKDDLYLTIAGTIGRVGEVPELFDKMNLTENALKITNININKKYLLIVLKSPYVQDYFASTYHQVAMPKLSLTNASKTIIPFPPISEQKRIVSKSEEMFERLDQIQNNLI